MPATRFPNPPDENCQSLIQAEIKSGRRPASSSICGRCHAPAASGQACASPGLPDSGRIFAAESTHQSNLEDSKGRASFYKSPPPPPKRIQDRQQLSLIIKHRLGPLPPNLDSLAFESPQDTTRQTQCHDAPEPRGASLRSRINCICPAGVSGQSITAFWSIPSISCHG